MTAKSLKILILDEDAFLALILRNKFQFYGFTAQVTSRLEALPQLMKDFVPDIVISEMVVDRASGFDICHEVRRLCHPGSPCSFIILTRAISFEEQQQSRQFGVDEVMLKTEYTFDEIVARICRMAGLPLAKSMNIRR